jgi:PIN domain nuclease of toxin-antitoxin system
VNLLLDTHIFLWSVLEPSRLTPAVREALTNGDNALWLSPISLWEVLVLAEKGRLELDTEPEAWARTALKQCPVREAALTHAVALACQRVTLPHGDPADRLLAATALVRNLTLVTADRRLIDTPEITVLANR